MRREQWLVLFGKSGLGKSSLLNAGLAPRLAQDDGMLPVFVRFHAWTEDRKETPLSIAGDLLNKKSVQSSNWFTKLAGNDRSLWRFLKESQIAKSSDTGSRGSTLLIFDQFEELFTFPQPAVEAFAKSLAEVFYTEIPERYRDALEQNPKRLSESELRQLHEPLPLRVVTAIRTDRMALMHQLKPFLPGTLDECYELRPLSSAAAEEAVLNPAYDPGDFRTPRFDYEDDALDALLVFLSSGRKQDIESFQLQILCEHLEKNVVERANQQRIKANDLVDPAGILENYYLDKIGEITDPGSRLAARKLIEEGLIFEEEERRLTLFEGQIQRVWGVDAALLARLEDTHLLRREPSLRGGYTYELSHDTLVAPVLKAKAKRIAEEREKIVILENTRKEEERMLREKAERAEIERQRAEEAEQLRNEAIKGRKRARAFAWLAGVVALLGLGLGVFAYMQSFKAFTASRLAQEKAVEAMRYSAIADSANSLALENLSIAQMEEAKARGALEQVEREKNATEAQRQQAIQNLMIAEKQGAIARQALSAQQATLAEIAQRTIRDAQIQIYRLDYEAALVTLKSATDLSANPDDVVNPLFEIAFFFAETGRLDRARGVLDTAIRLQNRDLSIIQKLTRLTDFRNAFKALNPRLFDELNARYFPSMLAIPGGTFTFGGDENDDEKPSHKVTLSNFRISSTEITWWQYNLFRAATGMEKPGWNVDGDNPVVNVNWYDAILYTNWLSIRQGLEPVYTIDSIARDTQNLRDFDDLKWSVLLIQNANGYRLPTESEWEYAARAGANFSFSGGDNLDSVAWYYANGANRTRPVAVKHPNAFGLYDMSGNVWEWCWDWYGNYAQSNIMNPAGPEMGSSRLLRGGSFDSYANSCRVSARNSNNPSIKNVYTGFRVAVSSGK